MTDLDLSELDDRTRELDRAHVFHSWSAQAGAGPARHRRRLGFPRLGPRRPQLPRLLQPAGQRQHRPPAPGGRRRDPGAGRPAHHDRTRHGQPRPRRGRPAHHRPRAGRLQQGLLHQRRRGRQRERHPDGAPAHRARQGALDLPLLPRQHRRGRRRDRRLAPHAQRVRPRPRALLRPLPLPQRVLGDDARAGVASARCTTCAASSRARARRRSPRSCSRRSPAPPACWCRRPATSPACGSSATSTASC